MTGLERLAPISCLIMMASIKNITIGLLHVQKNDESDFYCYFFGRRPMRRQMPRLLFNRKAAQHLKAFELTAPNEKHKKRVLWNEGGRPI